MLSQEQEQEISYQTMARMVRGMEYPQNLLHVVFNKFWIGNNHWTMVIIVAAKFLRAMLNTRVPNKVSLVHSQGREYDHEQLLLDSKLYRMESYR